MQRANYCKRLIKRPDLYRISDLYRFFVTFDKARRNKWFRDENGGHGH